MTFDIDANGILNVTARDKATNKEQKVTITASTNLSKNDVEQMVREARDNQAEDRRYKELVEVRNNADNLIYQAEKGIQELGERLPQLERQNISEKIETLRQVCKQDDLRAIERLTEELKNAVHALSQQAYTQTSTGPTAESGYQQNGDEQTEGDVIEGQFR